MKRHGIHLVVMGVLAALVGAGVWFAGLSPAQTEPAATSGTKASVSASERVTEPLRAEHRELIGNIADLRTAGDAVGVASLAAQRNSVHDSYTFLTTKLIPHAVAEDKVLYAEVDELVGTRDSTRATDTMRRDHTEVGTLTDELGALGDKLHEGRLTDTQEQELRRVLYALNAVVGLHFDKEEEVYLPLLDRELTADQAQEMFEEMEQVAASAGGGDHEH